MSEGKTNKSSTTSANQPEHVDTAHVPAGVTTAEEAAAKAAAKAVKDEPAVLPVEDASVVAKLPDNGVVLGTVTAVADPAKPIEVVAQEAGGAYADEFAGQGGTFIIDGETGQRRRAHTEVTDEKGKTIGFKPIP